MSQNNKTIEISPQFFSTNLKKTIKNKNRDKKQFTIKPNTLKRKLLNKIKEHASNTSASLTDSLDTSFDGQLQYLENISNKIKKKKQN